MIFCNALCIKNKKINKNKNPKIQKKQKKTDENISIDISRSDRCILSFYSQILSFYNQILSFITKKYRFTVGNQKIQIYGRLPSRKKIFAGFAGENFFPPSRSNSGRSVLGR